MATKLVTKRDFGLLVQKGSLELGRQDGGKPQPLGTINK
jgi:hypothetical protein